MEIREGISDAAKKNQWFQNNIAKNVAKAFYFETADNMVIQVARVEDPDTGRVSVFIMKFAQSGYMKSVMRLSPGDAKALVEILGKVSQ